MKPKRSPKKPKYTEMEKFKAGLLALIILGVPSAILWCLTYNYIVYCLETGLCK